MLFIFFFFADRFSYAYTLRLYNGDLTLGGDIGRDMVSLCGVLSENLVHETLQQAVESCFLFAKQVELVCVFNQLTLQSKCFVFARVASV